MRALLLALLAICSCVPTVGQSGNSIDQSQAQAFLQSHPEALGPLRAMLARQLQVEGSAIEPQSITTTMLAARLQSDSTFRELAIRQLVDQGVISEEQGRTAAAQLGGGSELERVGTAGSPQQANAPVTSKASKSAAPAEQFDDSVLNPHTVQQANPYPDLPSTKALYAQFPDEAKGLMRFGSDIFRPDVVGLNQFPMDLPAGPDYVLGPGTN